MLVEDRILSNVKHPDPYINNSGNGIILRKGGGQDVKRDMWNIRGYVTLSIVIYVCSNNILLIRKGGMLIECLIII